MTGFTLDPLATYYHFEVVNGTNLSVAIHFKAPIVRLQNICYKLGIY
jgi:hypothetical protein